MIQVRRRGLVASRIAVDVDKDSARKPEMPRQAGDIEGDVVVVVRGSEALENPRGCLECGARHLLVRAGDDPPVPRGVLDSGDGGELVTVRRGAQRGHPHAGHGGCGKRRQFEWAFCGGHCFNLSRGWGGREAPRGSRGD